MRKRIVAIGLLIPLLAFGQAQVPLPSAGLTPESSFYFLDKLGEALRAFFTFNPEGKARLQMTFAAERVSEIKIILETKGIEAKGLAVAQSRLQVHLAHAATLVTDRKAEGKDVSQLAKELNDEFEGPKSALEQAFKDQKRALKVQEKELKVKIRQARLAGDTVQIALLIKQLGEIKAREELLELEEEEQEEALEKELERLEEELEAKGEAEKAIREAEGAKQEVMSEAVEEDVALPQDAFVKFENLLGQAKELLGKENYQGAAQLARQAEKSLDITEELVGDLEEMKEKAEEQKEEEEKQNKAEREKAGGENREQEERAQEELEQEAKRLEEENKKLEEETRAAEEDIRKEL